MTVTPTLRQSILLLCSSELDQVYQEAEQWSEKGLLKEDAFLRKLVKDSGLDCDRSSISLAAFHVYRHFAQQYFYLIE